MKFAYMVQTEAALPPTFEALRGNPDVTLIHLSFKEPTLGAIYLPDSTWTEGRNALLAAARDHGADFDYYVFCDDDMEFVSGSFAEFNGQLARLQPAVATPLYDFAPNKHEEFAAHTVYAFDAMMNAFHRDLITDRIVLPYYAGFDTQSWWFSQFFVIHLASVLYPDHVIRLNSIRITNTMSRPYPRNTFDKWDGMERFVCDEIYADRIFLDERFRHHFDKKSEVPRDPIKPLRTYRLDDDMKAKLNLAGPFWANR